MQVVVTIPDEWVEWLEDGSFGKRNISNYSIIGALMTGEVLPNNHGRLIDVHELYKRLNRSWNGNNKLIVPYHDRKGYKLRNSEVMHCIVDSQTIIAAHSDEKF